MNNVEFFALDKDFDLAKKMTYSLGKSLLIPEVVTFADSEVRIDLPEDFDMEGKSALIIHSTVDPVNESYIKLFFLIDLLKRNGAQKVAVLTPYFGYARQCGCKKSERIGHAKVIAKLMECSGADAVFVVEIHDNKLKSFFSVDFTNVLLRDFISDHIKKTFTKLENYCLVATDKGTKKRVEDIAKQLKVESFFFSKERSGINDIEIVGMSEGNVEGKIAIIIDDIIDTGSTALKVASKLDEMGVEKIYAYFVHPVLSNEAAKRLVQSSIEKIFVTNSVELQLHEKIGKLEVLDISGVLSSIFAGQI